MLRRSALPKSCRLKEQLFERTTLLQWKLPRPLMPGVEMMADPYVLAQDADALVVMTEWNEFKQLDRLRLRDLMRHPVLYDGRNIYEPDEMLKMRLYLPGSGQRL